MGIKTAPFGSLFAVHHYRDAGVVVSWSWCRGRGSGLQLRTNPHHGIWNHVGDDDYAALSELQVVDGYGNIDKSCGRTPERWLRR
jgi:hypothetical protein